MGNTFSLVALPVLVACATAIVGVDDSIFFFFE